MENVEFVSESEEDKEESQRLRAFDKKRGREVMENNSVGASLNGGQPAYKRRKRCCGTCQGFGGIGKPHVRALAKLNSEQAAKRRKIVKDGVIRSMPVSMPGGHFKSTNFLVEKNCCWTCTGFGGVGLPPRKYLEKAQRLVQHKTPPKYIKWLKQRSEQRESLAVSEKVIQSPAWWYAQVCLACLKAVQHISLHGHLHGNQHRKVVTRNGLRPNFSRKIPMLVYPGSQSSNMLDENNWGRELITPLQVLPKEKFLDSVAELRKGQRCLVLGEQDFSFSNYLGYIVGGENVIGTCYLSKHDPNIPDVKTLNDGERRFHQQKCLGSMDGDLELNLTLADQTGVSIRYNVDAQDIQGSLLDKESKKIKPFNRIIFPFPRVSLIRGCDPNNSVLIHKFLISARDTRCLARGGLVQLVMLENQFREWDILHIAEEAGYKLRSLGWMNFDILPYQARDVTGKRIRSGAMQDKTLYISFAKDSNKRVFAKI